VIIPDLCVDEYTDHGHCGVLDDRGQPDNDATLEIYEQIAVVQAIAGADIVAPSGMMDGQVFAIREALDDAGFDQVAILAYAAKYATALYGPFRDAVDVTIIGGGDRKGYQQDVANAREAMEEIREDIGEGADIVMVKPAMPYLDVISRARQEIDIPLAAYHVSGEYAMVHAAAQNGWLELEPVAFEHIGAIKRAGADLILTYFSRLIAEGLQ
jgi:porphobilinogen synthase